MPEYGRLSAAAKDARKEYTDALNSMALSISESTITIFAARDPGRAK